MSSHPNRGQNDEPYEANNHFVVPEPDGVESGVPFHGPHGTAPTGAPSSLAAVVSTRRSVEAVPLRQIAQRGLGLRQKLNFAMGGLTGVILLVGAVSLTTLWGVAGIGESVAERYAPLAQLGADIQETTYLMREAEKDFALSEQQDALDRVSRYGERARNRLEQARTLATTLENETGLRLAGHFEQMVEAITAYTQRFAAQVKDIKDARNAQSQELTDTRDSQGRLLGEVRKAEELLGQLRNDYWETATEHPSRETASNVRLLERIDRELYNARLAAGDQVNRDEQAHAEIAQTALAEALVLADQARRQAGEGRLAQGLSDVRRSIAGYASLYREWLAKSAKAHSQHKVLEDRITAQREGLRESGLALNHLASNLAEQVWQSINRETKSLVSTSHLIQWVLASVVLLGGIVGLVVLFTVPRPIVDATNQILVGVEEMTRGDLTASLSINRTDELGNLAITFDAMRQRLLSLVQRIQRASLQLSSSVNEIQAAASQQASSATEQASAVNELSASLNEISQTANTLVASSENINRNVDEITTRVTDSNAKTVQVMASMDAIGSSTRQTADRIKALNDKMDNINEAVSTIAMVADQTTLLSLNASIEANKAGDMGKGFSVVASEIRRLSDRSIDSAGSIASLVRDIQRATESSAVAMDKSSEEVRHGVGLVKGSTEALGAIDLAMGRIQNEMGMMLGSIRAQADSSRMVQTTATELLSSANMVAKAAAQTQAVTYELNAMATQLAAAVASFRL